ncbi:MAG TPA: hypothetical protein DC047_20485 [Blastocatellia bacterium]|nr:hypothetical protein [Blastocatellia bacterium]
MNRKILVAVAVATFAVGSSGCSSTSDNANANADATQTVATDSTRPGADNSEITTSVDTSGGRTETRVFHNNPRVSKVVVTTRDGKRTVIVYAPSGEARELNKNEPEDVLEATGTTIADAAGFVADKTVQGAKTVAEKTVEGAKTVGDKTVEGARTVGEKTAEGTKTVVEKTGQGAKKTGRAIKKAITP